MQRKKPNTLNWPYLTFLDRKVIPRDRVATTRFDSILENMENEAVA